MSKKLTGIQPVRKIDGAWVEVPTHLAQAWAAVCNGNLVGRYPKRVTATLHLNAAIQRAKPFARYRLGSPMGERVREVLTISTRKGHTS